jgi:hypothetical protein
MLTKLNALENATGTKEKMSLIMINLFKMLISSLKTSAIHQPLLIGTIKSKHALVCTTKMVANKLIANGQLEKNSFKTKISALQRRFHKMLKASKNVST